MYPVIEIFGHTIGTYAICAMVGILVCFIVGYMLIKNKGVCIDDIIVSAVLIIIGLVIGGHIVFGITNIGSIIQMFKNASDYTFWKFVFTLFGQYLGGMVYYGGMLGGIAGLYVACRFTQFGHADVMYDMYAVCIPLFHFFGRIGCFLGGCCYGVECRFGFTVHGNTLNSAVNNVNRFPVQLVEAGCNLLIFVLLFILHRKGKFRQRLLIVYFYTYPVVRFILEFFRGDEIRGFLFGLSTSQIISILLLLFAVGFTVVDRKKKG